MGEYVEQEEKHNGRVYYMQRHTEGEVKTYLYFWENTWKVGNTLGNGIGGIRNRQDALLPPTSGWEYWDNTKWVDDDTTLGLKFSRLTPCRIICVEGDREVRRHQSSSLGNYRFQINRWSCGRPVYQLINSDVERYLLVAEGWTSWSSMDSTNATGAHITGGRGTNSPTSAEAGPRVIVGVTRWRFSNSGWKEGDVTFSCLD